jgi:hypothetical protein
VPTHTWRKALGVRIPVLTCVLGAILGFSLPSAAVRYGERPNRGAQGDNAQVTATYTAFGLKVWETTGPRWSYDERSLAAGLGISCLSSIVGGASGLLIGIWLVRTRTK